MGEASVDKKAFRSLSYGLYIVTAMGTHVPVGCVVNTFAQVTSAPPQVSIAINKENITTGVILATGAFEVSVLAQDAPMELIGRFGFHTSADFDKFADTKTAVDERGIPYVSEHAVAHFGVQVKQTLDLGTHMYIMGEVVESAVLSKEAPMTYAYYHQVKGGKTPPKASSYEGEADLAPATAAGAASADAVPSAGAAPTGGSAAGATRVAWRCMVCGHIEYADELPEDFRCPVCGAGRERFEKIEVSVS